MSKYINEKSATLQWNDNVSADEWDRILASMQGHPLQSAKWGDAKKLSDKIKDQRWIAYRDEKPVYLIRFEERYLLKFLKIAWVPKGPSLLNLEEELLLTKEFLKKLKQKSIFLCAMSSNKQILANTKEHFTQQTIWLDLKLGAETLWKKLHSSFRRHIRNAKKRGVVVEQSKTHEDARAFYQLCKETSVEKGFCLHTTEKNFNKLVLDPENKYITSHLFVARQEDKFCGGLFVIRCGENIHNWLAAVDRNFAKYSIGEILHWEVVEWAVNQKCQIYDLEGIDKKNNRSVYDFKIKMGGEIITFSGIQLYPLNLIAIFAVNYYNAKRFFQSIIERIKAKKIFFAREST